MYHTTSSSLIIFFICQFLLSSAFILPDPKTIEGSQDDTAASIPRPSLLGTRCSINASWHRDDVYFGGELVPTTEDGMTTYGSLVSNRVSTPLHAQFQILLWIMKSSIQVDHISVAFKTGCKKKKTTDHLCWAEFDVFHLVHSMFTFCTIFFIFRSLNFCTIILQKAFVVEVFLSLM